MTFVIDIDNHLIKYSEEIQNQYFPNFVKKYEEGKPNQEEIDRVNWLYDRGHIIIIHTGRNWDKYIFTKNQLKEFGIKHYELVMGKPQGVYIDIDSEKSLDKFVKDKK
jgi:hypothetical protein